MPSSQHKIFKTFIPSAAATGGVLQEKMFLEISQNSQETHVPVSFLLKLQADGLY